MERELAVLAKFNTSENLRSADYEVNMADLHTAKYGANQFESWIRAYV